MVLLDKWCGKLATGERIPNEVSVCSYILSGKLKAHGVYNMLVSWITDFCRRVDTNKTRHCDAMTPEEEAELGVSRIGYLMGNRSKLFDFTTKPAYCMCEYEARNV